MATPSPLKIDAGELITAVTEANKDLRIQTAQRLLEEVRGSVVQVVAGKGNTLACDGFFINDGTEVVTSQQILNAPDGAGNIQVITSAGEVFEAQMLPATPGHNELVLKLRSAKAGSHKSLKLGNSDDLIENESLYLYGHRDWNKPPVLAAGRMQSHYIAKTDAGNKQQFIDFVAPEDIGLSGSPLINRDGEVVGMYHAPYPNKSETSKKVLIRFNDVYELEKILDPKLAVSELAEESQEEATQSVESAKPQKPVEKPTDEQLKAITDKIGQITKPTVIEIGAEWCPACKMMERVLDKTEKANGESLQLVRVNFDKEKDLAEAYEVTALPTTIYIGVSPDGEILYQKKSRGYSPAVFQHHIDQLMKDRQKSPESP